MIGLKEKVTDNEKEYPLTSTTASDMEGRFGKKKQKHSTS